MCVCVCVCVCERERERERERDLTYTFVFCWEFSSLQAKIDDVGKRRILLETWPRVDERSGIRYPMEEWVFARNTGTHPQ